MKTKTQKRIEELEQDIQVLYKENSNLRDEIRGTYGQKETDIRAVYYHYDNGLEIDGKYMIRYLAKRQRLGAIERTDLARWTGSEFVVRSTELVPHNRVINISDKVELPEV
jgi:hypothetical protein